MKSLQSWQNYYCLHNVVHCPVTVRKLCMTELNQHGLKARWGFTPSRCPYLHERCLVDIPLQLSPGHSIFAGKEHNFAKYEDDFITDLNTPYDYESVMHYRPLSFNKNDTVPTITTTIPYFNEIIGQRFDFSAVDLVRLNRMYDCGGYSDSFRSYFGTVHLVHTWNTWTTILNSEELK